MYTIFMILFLCMPVYANSSDDKSPEYRLGQDVTKGAMDTFYKAVGQNMDNSTQKTVEQIFQNAGKAAGRGLTEGAVATIYKEVGQNMGNSTQKTVEQITNAAVKGLNNSLKKGGEFDSLFQNAGKAGGRGLVEGSKELGAGAKQASTTLGKDTADSFNNFNANLAPAFAPGGELDKMFNGLMDTGAGNINKFMKDAIYPNMIMFSAIGLATAGGYYTLQYGIPFAIRMIERRLTRPKLIIEFYKKTYYTYFFGVAKQASEMIFSPTLKKHLDDIVKVTSMINKKINEGKTNVKYRNLMLYGPPGTGKTMFAKELARQSGLDYAFMSGSSFSKFKDGEGIEALDELFAWAKRSKGLMIFIDEAETFLSKRENMDPQSKAYQLLNNFLNYTGERSNKFMLVFATNHKDALDSAMYRRIDDLIEMPLPSLDQRINTLIFYRKKILLDSKNNDQRFIDSVHRVLNDDMIKSIAKDTKGLSYGDLEGIMNTIKTDSTILDPEIVTRDLVSTVVERAVKKHDAFTNGNYLGFVEN